MKKIFEKIFPIEPEDHDSELLRLSAELKETLERLKEEKEQREALLGSMEEGVIVTDRRGNVTMANRKAEQLFGKDLHHKRVVEISRNPELHRIIEEGSRKGETVTGEISINAQPPMTLSATMTPLVRNNQTIGSVIVFHDITLLKKLETMRIDFVANVSHELKTPLTAIRGFAETLKEGALDDREHAVRFVDIIHTNAERLSRLVDDLLTLSNIELGKISFDLRPVPLGEVTSAVTATLEPKARAKGIAVECDIKEGILVHADRDRLLQILLNLVDNGIKYTEKGSIRISAAIEKDEVHISVTDTGTGIPPKDIGRLGERFYRVDPARSRELGGTGLGLAIVKHLTTSMGGRFYIESEPFRGTVVSIMMKGGSS